MSTTTPNAAAREETVLPTEPLPPPRRPRVWPAIGLVVALWGFRFVVARVELTTFVRFGLSMLVLAVVLLGFLAWWLISRRTSWAERLVGLLGAVAIVIGAERLAHPSLHGMVWVFTAVPVALAVWAGWWLIARGATPAVRTGGLLATLLIACGSYDLARMDGLSGEQHVALHWRWSLTGEQRYLADLAKRHARATTATRATVASLISARSDDWPGFRGANRDGVVRELSISTDWSAHPPKPVWRMRVGPGWSSPIVVGGRIFTQEQRGNVESVICRDADTGEERWSHDDVVRFEESLSGPGPRATPTFADGKLFTLGATGILNCLDAVTGQTVWSRTIAAEGGVKLPIWGFASSPVVTGGLVIVYAGGPVGLVAHRADSGGRAWSIASGDQSYTSPQLARLAGREQVLFLSDHGLVGVEPGSGRILFEHVMDARGAPRAIQPHPISDTQVLVSSETDLGTALLEITSDGGACRAERKWVTRALKPSFNDFVIHDGHAYGFDGAVFCCTDLTASGRRNWRDGRYGHGQVILLDEQGLLLVVGEEGDVVMLRATPEHLEELGRFHAVDGKMWSHPAVARGRLFVRSGEELACFELAELSP